MIEKDVILKVKKKIFNKGSSKKKEKEILE